MLCADAVCPAVQRDRDTKGPCDAGVCCPMLAGLAGLTPRLCAETSGPTQNPGTRPRPPRVGEHAQCREGGAGFTGRGEAGQGSPAHPTRERSETPAHLALTLESRNVSQLGILWDGPGPRGSANSDVHRDQE